jgi:hypothetical protein
MINKTKKGKISKKSKISKIRNKTQKYSSSKKTIVLLKDNQVELLLLFSILINYFILLKKNNASRKIYKKKIIDLLKDLRKNNKYLSENTTDAQINILYKQIYKYFNNILNSIENILPQSQQSHSTHSTHSTHQDQHQHQGGFYFRNIEDNPDKPVTGADVTKLLDDIQQFFYNAKYTTEGQFLVDTDAVLSMLRGDINQFKGILQYRIFPKYYTPYPPFINWAGIRDAIENKKWEDIPDYLLAYQSYLRSRDEYDVERGLKSPSVLQKDLYNGFYNKVAHSLDTNIQQFQQYRNKFQGRFFPITVPQ